MRAPTPFTVIDGACFLGKFSGFGSVEVVYDKVSGAAFTHVAPLQMLGLPLGVFRHTYETTSEPAGGSVLTQTVVVTTRGLGLLLGGVFEKAFRKRMPVSFQELADYDLRQRLGRNQIATG